MADSNLTKNAIAASMKKLMRRKPFEKISVSDICEDCGINRKSFYYHFRDKYDLVNWIFYVGFIGVMDLSAYDSGWEVLEDMCRYFYSERQFYRAALQIEGQNSFRDYLIETAEPIAKMFMQDILPADADREFSLLFISDAFLVSLVRWLSGKYDREMDENEFLSRIKATILSIAKSLENQYVL